MHSKSFSLLNCINYVYTIKVFHNIFVVFKKNFQKEHENKVNRMLLNFIACCSIGEGVISFSITKIYVFFVQIKLSMLLS